MQNSANPDDLGLFPIRTVASQTGVNAATLRAWERRYGLVIPKRTPKGHRLYSLDDIHLIQKILNFLERGIPIGQISAVLQNNVQPDELQDNPWQEAIQQCLSAIEKVDDRALFARLNELLAVYPIDVIQKRLLRSLLESLQNTLSESHKAFAMAQLIHYFQARLFQNNQHLTGQEILLIHAENRMAQLDNLLYALDISAQGKRCLLMPWDSNTNQALSLLSKQKTLAAIVFSEESCLEIAHDYVPIPQLLISTANINNPARPQINPQVDSVGKTLVKHLATLN